MSKTAKTIAVALLACAVGAVLVAKHRKPDAAVALAEEDLPQGKMLPRLVDLGADKCIPCKLMAPILAELKQESVGTFDVEFIDVWENPQAGEKYGIRMIPTQIFYDAAGKELFRHEGFFGRDEILAKWREHGVGVAANPGE